MAANFLARATSSISESESESESGLESGSLVPIISASSEPESPESAACRDA